MNRYNKDIGNLGENKAEAYLKRRRYEILKRNYNTKGGELDIIARKNDCICFVEVKTRTDKSYGEPMDAVDYYKRKHMYKAAQTFCISFDEDYDFRFDVIEVRLKKIFMFYYASINHLKDVMQ